MSEFIDHVIGFVSVAHYEAISFQCMFTSYPSVPDLALVYLAYRWVLMLYPEGGTSLLHHDSSGLGLPLNQTHNPSAVFFLATAVISNDMGAFSSSSVMPICCAVSKELVLILLSPHSQKHAPAEFAQ